MTFLPIDSLVPPELRASVRATIAALDHPHASAQADEVADLVHLAVTEALLAIDRVAGRASNFGAQVAVMSAAGSTTRAVLERLENALAAYAKDNGAAICTARVVIGGQAQ